MSAYKTTVQKPLEATLQLVDSEGTQHYVSPEHLQRLGLSDQRALLERVKASLAYLLTGNDSKTVVVQDNDVTDIFMQVLIVAMREADPKKAYEIITASEYSEAKVQRVIATLTGNPE